MEIRSFRTLSDEVECFDNRIPRADILGFHAEEDLLFSCRDDEESKADRRFRAWKAQKKLDITMGGE